MGHRANFVVCGDGQREIWFSQFGATSIPGTLLGGERAFLDYVRELDRREELLDATWCEGAVALDLDRRRLLFFEDSGNHHFNKSPGLRRLYMPHLRASWPDWDVDWAHDGTLDISCFVGLPVAPWERPRPAPLSDGELEGMLNTMPYYMGALISWKEYREELEQYPEEHPYGESIVSLRREDGTAQHVSGCDLERLLFRGPDVIEVLARAESVPLPNELCADAGALIDATAKQMTVWWGRTVDARVLTAVQSIWPGWTLARQTDGLPWQAEACGVSKANVELSLVHGAKQLADVFGFRPEDSAAMIREHLARLEREGASAIVLPRTALEPGMLSFDRMAKEAAVIDAVLRGAPP